MNDAPDFERGDDALGEGVSVWTEGAPIQMYPPPFVGTMRDTSGTGLTRRGGWVCSLRGSSAAGFSEDSKGSESS